MGWALPRVCAHLISSWRGTWHLLTWCERGRWGEDQEIPGLIGKFGFGEQNEAGQRLTEFCQRMHWSYQNILFQQHKR